MRARGTGSGEKSRTVRRRAARALVDLIGGVRGGLDGFVATGPLHPGFHVLARELRRDLHASIEASMRKHGIEFVPGAAELGDFDPTSTAIALDPCGEGERLPRAALLHTFERYWQELDARRIGTEIT